MNVVIIGLVCLIIGGIGLWKNEKDREMLAAEYSMLKLFFAGIFGGAMLVGIVLSAAGHNGLPLILVGFVGTILFELTWLKSSEVGPVREWIRCTLWGIGKAAKLVLYCTVIGIIPVRMMQSNIQTVDYLNKRSKAEYEKNYKEELQRYREMQKIMEEAEQKVREERRRDQT